MTASKSGMEAVIFYVQGHIWYSFFAACGPRGEQGEKASLIDFVMPLCFPQI